MDGYWPRMITIVSIVACLFVYWLLIRGTTRLRRRTRAWLIGGYACVHAVSWLAMHLAARADFGASVAAMHVRGQAGVERDIQTYAEFGIEPSKGEMDWLKKRVHARPYWSLKSFSPLPCVLVGYRSYSIGPLWGLGETWLYVFKGDGLGVVAKQWDWVS